MYRDPTILEGLFYALVFAVVAAGYVRDRVSSDPDPINELREQYERGEIDHAEYERRLEFHLDDRNEQIRRVVEDVNGVGEATSKAIAHEFSSLGELRSADQEELEAVNGVGEKTAEAVLERV